MASTKFSPISLFLILALCTALFCLAIGLDVSPFLRGPAPYPPEWRWIYDFTNTLGRIWVPISVILIGVIGFLYFDTKNMQKGRFFSLKAIGFLVIFAMLLQLSILFFSRAGIGVLLERIINPGISGYFTTALSIHNVGDFLSSYQRHVMDFPMRAADHPPFAILFYLPMLILSQQLHVLFPFVEKVVIHHNDIAVLWNHLQAYQKLAALFTTLIIPILSASVLIPLYFYTKLYYDMSTAIRACFLYTVIPSVSLFLPLHDTFLGLFVMLAFLFFILAQKKDKKYWYIFSGISIVIGAFFSVSLIVPIGILFLMIFLWNRSKKEKLITSILVLIGIGCIPAVLLVYHFNTLGVFVEITKLQAKRSYLPWVFYDLYDFFIFSGIPIAICSFLIIKHFFFKKITKDHLAVCFFITIFLLDISGVSRAETGRIWMPYMPLLAVIVASYLTKERKISSAIFVGILVLQCIQVLVMQEFWVTLW